MRAPSLVGVALIAIAGALAAQEQVGGYEKFVKEIIDTVEQISRVLASVQDRDGAEKARPELKAAAQKLLEFRKQAEDWKQPNQAEKDRLAKEYAPKMAAAVKKLRDETARVKGIPGGREAVSELAILEDKKKDEGKDKKSGK